MGRHSPPVARPRRPPRARNQPLAPRPPLPAHRIHHRVLLAPATLADTADDVRFRLHAAGCERPQFPDDALAALHQLSQGALREVDRLASAALRDPAHRQEKLVDKDAITRVAETLAHVD